MLADSYHLLKIRTNTQNLLTMACLGGTQYGRVDVLDIQRPDDLIDR